MVTSSLIAADPPVTGVAASVLAAVDGRPVNHTDARAVHHIRRLRVTAWALRRLLREPRRMPGAWATPAFAARLDRVRMQLLPIRTLAALADSFGREHGADDQLVRMAYGLRWLELSGALDERPWRLHCRARAR